MASNLGKLVDSFLGISKPNTEVLSSAQAPKAPLDQVRQSLVDECFQDCDSRLIGFLSAEEMRELSPLPEYRRSASSRLKCAMSDTLDRIPSSIQDELALLLEPLLDASDKISTLKLYEVQRALKEQAKVSKSALFRSNVREDARRYNQLEEFLERRADELSKIIEQRPIFPALIDAICIAPQQDELLLFSSCLEERFTELFDGENDIAKTGAELPRIISFLRHVVAIEHNRKDGVDSLLFDENSGLPVASQSLRNLVHDDPWMLYDTRLRPLFMPILAEMRERYLADYDEPTADSLIESKPHPYYLPSGFIKRALGARADMVAFVEAAFRYECDPLRQHLLARSPFATLYMQAGDWGQPSASLVTAECSLNALKKLIQVGEEYNSRFDDADQYQRKKYDWLLRDRFIVLRDKLNPLIETVQCLLSARGAHRDMIRRCYFEQAGVSELELFASIVDVYRSQREIRVRSIIEALRTPQYQEQLRDYLLAQPSLEKAEAPLAAISREFSKPTVAHLLRISRGDSDRLSILAAESARIKQWQKNPLTDERLLSATELAPLVEELRTITLKKAVRIASALLSQDDRQHEQRVDLSISAQLDAGLTRIYHHNEGMSVQELLDAVSKDEFLDVISGCYNATMKLPPTTPQPITAILPGDSFVRLFPRGVLPLMPSRELDDRNLTPELINLRQRIMERANQFIGELSASADLAELTEYFTANLERRERFFSLIYDREFGNDVVLPLIAKAGVRLPRYELMVAEKSSPFSWNVSPCGSMLRRRDHADLILLRDGTMIDKSPMFLGADEKTLLVEKVGCPGELWGDRGTYRDAIIDFLSCYAEGRYAAPKYLASRKFEQVLIGSSYSELPLQKLPKFKMELSPRGDGAEKSGAWSLDYGDHGIELRRAYTAKAVE